MFPLSHMLKSFVRIGTLKVIDAEGQRARLRRRARAQGHHAADAIARSIASSFSTQSCTRAKPIWTGA